MAEDTRDAKGARKSWVPGGASDINSNVVTLNSNTDHELGHEENPTILECNSHFCTDGGLDRTGATYHCGGQQFPSKMALIVHISYSTNGGEGSSLEKPRNCG